MFDISNINVEIPSSRPLHRYKYQANPDKVCQNLNLTDKDAADNAFSFSYPSSSKYKSNHIAIETGELGFQVIKGRFDKATTTQYKIQKNKIMMTEQINPAAKLDKETKERLNSFLNDKFGYFEDALLENETLNIYIDDLGVGDNLKNKDSSETGLSVIKEKKSFEYEYCKQKLVSDIRFLNEHRIMAISLIEDLTYEERIDLNGRSFDCFIVLWDYKDLHRFTPIAILESPVEITCFEFKPDNPRYLIAGGINGQVYLYDLIKLTKISTTSTTLNKRVLLDTFNKNIEYIKPVLSSSIVESFNANQNLISNDIYSRKGIHLSSHRSCIKSLYFLQEGVEIDRKNPTKLVKYEGEEIPNRDQFVTISNDGHLLIWDLNFSDFKEKKMMRLEEVDFAKINWKALLSIQCFKFDNVILNTNNMILKPMKQSTRLFFTSDEGQLSELDFDIESNFNKEINKIEILKQRWIPNEENFPIAIDISLFNEGLVIVLCETNFYLYSPETDKPVFTSPFIESARFTCAKFSPKRPSVLFLGRNDGIIDIWDFCDQTGQASQQHLVSAVGISFLQLNVTQSDLMAVGDYDSCVKLLTLPTSLYKKLNNEEKLMKEFILKESKRNTYYQKKFSELKPKYEVEDNGGENIKGVSSDNESELSYCEEVELENVKEEYGEFLEECLEMIGEGKKEEPAK